MCQEGGTFDRTQFLIEEWKTVIETQIHFNEMIIRARTTGVSVVMAVYQGVGSGISNRVFVGMLTRRHGGLAITHFIINMGRE